MGTYGRLYSRRRNLLRIFLSIISWKIIISVNRAYTKLSGDSIGGRRDKIHCRYAGCLFNRAIGVGCEGISTASTGYSLLDTG